MRRLLTLFLLTVLLSPSVHAQLDSTDKKIVDQAAFQLTKATVEFVATDKLTFGNLSKTTCETCADYASLIQFIKTSKLTKADELVRDAQKKVVALTMPTATADQILTGLKQYLHNRATTGDDRERRTKLPSYTTYTTRVATILAGAGVAGEPVAANGPQTAADTMDTGELAGPTSSVTKADTGIFSYGGIALILSLLNLAGLAYLWSIKNTRTAAKTESTSQLAEVSSRMVILERERKELANRIARLEKVANTPAERTAPTPDTRRPDVVTPKPAPTQSAPQPARPAQSVQPATPQPMPAPQPVQTQPAPQPVPTSQPSFQSQATPSNQPRRREVVLYGRTADLGDGFSVASLLTAPDRDTVFQIEVRTDSQAIYRVTEEPGAQQLALSDPYSYLADACEYLAKPIPNARIRTDQLGQLALQGDKWRIVEKAKISFY